MHEKVIIIGAGGHGKVIADIVAASGDEVVGFLDSDCEKKAWYGYPVLGGLEKADYFSDCSFIIAVGNNEARKIIARKTIAKWYMAIHPRAVVSPSAVIGEGSVVMANSVINSDAVVGRHCIINTGAIVEHDNSIEDFVHISSDAALGGTVFIGEETHIGIGASIRNNINICGGCTIGAGAVVVADIAEPGTYIGIPAKKVEKIDVLIDNNRN